MRVLVTGHKGYVGSCLVEHLVAAGHQVTGLDSDLFVGCMFIPPEVEVPYVKGDVRDVEAADLAGFDGVIHLAGLCNDPLGNLDPALTDQINHRASVRLAHLARAAGVPRFLFASSCSVYGAAGDDLVDEEAACHPVTPYARSKLLVEEDVMVLAGRGFSPTFLRSGTAYGVSPRLRFDLVLNNLTAWACATGRILLKSDGAAWRPLVHVEDVAGAFLAVLEAPRERVHNQVFNVGASAENYRVRELAEIVATVVPDCRVERVESATHDERSYRADCGKLARLLPGFDPAWDVRRGVQQLHQAFLRTPVPVDNFEGPRYRRVACIKRLLSDGRLDANLRWRNGEHGQRT